MAGHWHGKPLAAWRGRSVFLRWRLCDCGYPVTPWRCGMSCARPIVRRKRRRLWSSLPLFLFCTAVLSPHPPPLFFLLTEMKRSKHITQFGASVGLVSGKKTVGHGSCPFFLSFGKRTGANFRCLPTSISSLSLAALLSGNVDANPGLPPLPLPVMSSPA